MNQSRSTHPSSWPNRWIESIAAAVFILAVLTLTQIAFGPEGNGLPPAQSVARITGWAMPLLSSSIALGFVVMAIVQLLKPPLRAAFHRRQIAHWLGHPGRPAPAAGDGPGSTPVNPPPAAGAPLGGATAAAAAEEPPLSPDEFLARVSHARPEALLELPIEQLTAQIQAAAELVLATDETGDPLVRGIAGGPDDTSRVQMRAIPEDHHQSSTLEADATGRARTEASYVIQRRLDALQIEVRQRWRRILRFLALIVSIAISSLLAAMFGLWDTNLVGTALLVLLMSALGGFFASVARDAVAILERIRG